MSHICGCKSCWASDAALVKATMERQIRFDDWLAKRQTKAWSKVAPDHETTPRPMVIVHGACHAALCVSLPMHPYHVTNSR